MEEQKRPLIGFKPATGIPSTLLSFLGSKYGHVCIFYDGFVWCFDGSVLKPGFWQRKRVSQLPGNGRLWFPISVPTKKFINLIDEQVGNKWTIKGNCMGPINLAMKGLGLKELGWCPSIASKRIIKHYADSINSRDTRKRKHLHGCYIWNNLPDGGIRHDSKVFQP